MSANTSLTVTGLNYDTIRTNLRNFIAAKPEFADYDFNDSAIGTLLDLLAYNTYYNAFYTNMAAGEAFIDSAQLYDSVVSRAKLMNYVPVSARGAQANVRISFTTAQANVTSPTLTIAKNTKFTSTINGVSYTFVTPKTYTISANSSNRFRQDVDLIEGYPLTHKFAFTSSNTSFILPNENVDTRSITATVTTSGNTESYILVDDILEVNSSSKVFYLEADRERKYKIGFGDNVLGQRPAYNSTVSISYRVCNAVKGNGANNFVAVSAVAGETNFTLRVNERAVGGADQESIESVKFNAPKAYETQNRSVITNDYQRLILRDNKDLQAVNVWGGEDNDPPIYGKTFATVKPYQGSLISSARKEDIKKTIAKYAVQCIKLEIVDPTFLYIVPEVEVKYDSRLTTRTASEIAALIAARIITYETNNFSRFDSRFWFSKFLNYLDQADNGIVGTNATISLQKRFSPSTINLNTYTFKFNTPLQNLGNASQLLSETRRNPGYGWLTSSAFTFKGESSYLDDNGFGDVRIYYPNATLGQLGRVYNEYEAGSIDYDTGTLELTEFYPTAFSGNEMKINVKPLSPNITAVRNQLLFFADASIVVQEINSRNAGARVTTIATAGQSSTVNETGLSIETSY